LRATRGRWRALCERLGAKGNPVTGRTIDSTYDEIITAYTGLDRHYHNLSHINEGLILLDEVSHLADDPDTLEMAWWWHDYICKAGESDNERQSADAGQKALVDLAISPKNRIRVECHTLATKHDFIPESNDSRLIVCIDLAGLAFPPELFDQVTDNIRKEYAQLSDNHFRTGQAIFFRRFLENRPSIYLTEYFRDRYETQAQENIRRLIAKADT